MRNQMNDLQSKDGVGVNYNLPWACAPGELMTKTHSWVPPSGVQSSTVFLAKQRTIQMSNECMLTKYQRTVQKYASWMMLTNRTWLGCQNWQRVNLHESQGTANKHHRKVFKHSHRPEYNCQQLLVSHNVKHQPDHVWIARRTQWPTHRNENDDVRG